MLHRDYDSKWAWPGPKQMEISFLGSQKNAYKLSFLHKLFPHFCSQLPSWSRASGSKSVIVTAVCTFHLWGLYSPKAELHTYSVFLLSSLAPFLTTLPRCCSSLSFPHHELFFLKRLNIGNAAGYQQWEFLMDNKLLHASSSIYSQKRFRKQVTPELSLTFEFKCRMWVGRPWRKDRETNISKQCLRKQGIYSYCWWCWLGEGRAQEELVGTLRGLKSLIHVTTFLSKSTSKWSKRQEPRTGPSRQEGSHPLTKQVRAYVQLGLIRTSSLKQA